MSVRSQPYQFIGCEAEYDDAAYILFGAPFDSTTSFRPGARFGPSAMRMDSVGLETYSPYQDKDLCDLGVFDIGDIEAPFGDPVPLLASIEMMTESILRDGKHPVMLGGEHLVTLGAVRAVHGRYPDLHILHLDAHADLRDEYLGAGLSHACVMRRCWEIVGDGRIHQFGIRSGSKEEFEFAAEGHVYQRRMNTSGFSDKIRELDGTPVYVSIDLDVLDPSLFAGTGTPEAGGIRWNEMMTCILSLRNANVVGFDLCELAPHYDSTGVSTAVACKVLREMLLAL